MVMGICKKNLRVFNFTILLKDRENLMLVKYTCFAAVVCSHSNSRDFSCLQHRTQLRLSLSCFILFAVELE